MADKLQITPKQHKKQVVAYAAVRPSYELYAATLERVLKQACRSSFPDAFVQTRAKTVSSFAEKAARKFVKYPDAVNQMDDLCGARVIVQTTEQVRAVRRFIEANFEIVEKENKGSLLGEQQFGYRDMHYIVRLRADRDKILGITKRERSEIAERRAEVQVRTWLQHAWADTLHDRVYKNKLNISSEAKRTGNLLAALMEEGDRSFNRLADELDGLIANYTATARKTEIEQEIKIQRLILSNETDADKKPALAMRLARLFAACGDYAQVVDLLTPYDGIKDAKRCELLLELGHALCRLNRNAPLSPGYSRGRNYLQEGLEMCESEEVPFVPHLRNREGLHARALSRLARALAPIPNETARARDCCRQAHEREPGNPYHLAEMLGLEMSCGNRAALAANMQATIRQAAGECRRHAAAGIELPDSCFTGGRLNLLLGETCDALGCYARGIRHCLSGLYCLSADFLAEEIDWLKNSYRGDTVPASCRNAIDLLELGRGMADQVKPRVTGSILKPPVLIIAGGAVSIDRRMLARIRPLIRSALSDFSGTILAGGIGIGVPGCVGNSARQLADEGTKKFRLVGYLPSRLPGGVYVHNGYDSTVRVGDDFLPDQILRNWRDILDAGISPGDVLVLGLGGGPLSELEYRVALGLGASVGIVEGTGGTADKLLKDDVWPAMPNLYPLPFDPATVRAFVVPGNHALAPAVEEEMAMSFHRQYVLENKSKLPQGLRPWSDLAETYLKANREQAKYSVEILKACGYGVKQAKGAPKLFAGFRDGDLERMAEMEHGRWNVERLRDGWRHGIQRDEARKMHDCLIPWSELPDSIKEYDRNAVRAFPKILSQAGLEITSKVR